VYLIDLFVVNVIILGVQYVSYFHNEKFTNNG